MNYLLEACWGNVVAALTEHYANVITASASSGALPDIGFIARIVQAERFSTISMAADIIDGNPSDLPPDTHQVHLASGRLNENLSLNIFLQ